MSDPDPKPEKWVYQRPPEVRKSDFSPGGFFGGLVRGCMYIVCFTLIPIAVYIAVDWIVYFVTRDTFYREHWVQPAILLAATFLGGAYARMVMEENYHTMGVFFLGMIGMILFAGINYLLSQNPASLFGPFLPTAPLIHTAWLPGVPLVGMAGMFCYQFFSLKHTI